MALDFPSSPTVGQQVTIGGVTWTWDGVKWTAGASSAGSTVVGGINDNRIINGDMRIDQRNGGAQGSASAYTVDRWGFNGTLNKGTWKQNYGGAGPAAFPYYLGFQSSSAYTPLAADQFNFSQPLEADTVSDFQWGTANAQPVTLSFWAISGLTGIFSGSICNYTGARSYPFTYSLPTPNTWTKVVLTIPGDTAGTWVMSGNAGSMYLRFDLGSGSNSRGPANAWGSGNYIGATGAVSVVSTNAAAFYVTGVKLEIGSVATPFNRQSPAKSMADCQRYFIAYTSLNLGVNFNATWGPFLSFPVLMRATPTATGSYTSGTFAATPQPYGVSLSNSANSWGAGPGTSIITLTAQFSAEL